MRRVAEIANSIANAQQVLWADQQVDVARLPQSNVAVKDLRKGQAFIRHRINAERGQVVHDANQFARKQ